MQSYPVRSFAYGRLSQRFASRTDSAFYAHGCEVLTNNFALPIGPSEKRPGTIYAATGKTAGKRVRLIPWILSPTEGIVIELGDSYARFYKNGARIENPPGTPVEVVTPWLEAELEEVRFAQVTSYMYLVHPSYTPRKLTRTSDTVWGLSAPTFTGDATFSTSGNYPSHVEFYEDRLLFARTLNDPATFWGSRLAITRTSTCGPPIARWAR